MNEILVRTIYPSQYFGAIDARLFRVPKIHRRNRWTSRVPSVAVVDRLAFACENEIFFYPKRTNPLRRKTTGRLVLWSGRRSCAFARGGGSRTGDSTWILLNVKFFTSRTCSESFRTQILNNLSSRAVLRTTFGCSVAEILVVGDGEFDWNFFFSIIKLCT